MRVHNRNIKRRLDRLDEVHDMLLKELEEDDYMLQYLDMLSDRLDELETELAKEEEKTRLTNYELACRIASIVIDKEDKINNNVLIGALRQIQREIEYNQQTDKYFKLTNKNRQLIYDLKTINRVIELYVEYNHSLSTELIELNSMQIQLEEVIRIMEEV